MNTKPLGSATTDAVHPSRPQTPTTPNTAPTCGTLTVMYDGSCPLCQREIGLYQSLTPLQPVAWLDVSAADLPPATRQQLMARFHVQHSDGQLLSGAAAFVALWLNMPGWRWLGRLGRLPGVTPILEMLYRGFLPIRPTLQKWLKKHTAA